MSFCLGVLIQVVRVGGYVGMSETHFLVVNEFLLQRIVAVGQKRVPKNPPYW